MEAYYAVLKTTNEAVEVFFPDLEGCVTFGDDMEEAINMAEDVLSGYLEVSEKIYIKKPSSYNAIYEKYGNKKNILINKIYADPAIKRTYKKKKRINTSFTAETLDIIDKKANNLGLNRSHFLEIAAIAYDVDMQI